MQDIPPQGHWPAPYDRERSAVALERWRSLGPACRDMADDADGAALLGCLFGNSPYLSESALSDPAFLIEMWHQDADVAVDSLFAGLDSLRQQISAAPAADRVGAALRRAKRRLALAVAVADIAGRWDLARVTGALSRFAGTATSIAVDTLLLQLDRQGVLRLDGEPDRAGLTILGMGKLGAHELNYSSDIDLIVLYDRDAPAVAGHADHDG